MLSTDVRLNFHLKREILMLASEISARDTLSTEDYIITRDELRGIDIPDQNVVLQRHLDALREIRSTLEAQRPESSFSSSLTSMHGEASESHWRQRTGHLTQRCRSALLLVAALLLFALSNALWSSFQQFRPVPAGEPYH